MSGSAQRPAGCIEIDLISCDTKSINNESKRAPMFDALHEHDPQRATAELAHTSTIAH